MEFKYSSVAAFIQAHGEKEALSCLKVGFKQKWYRKQINMRNQALLEMAKNDPRLMEKVQHEAKKRSA